MIIMSVFLMFNYLLILFVLNERVLYTKNTISPLTSTFYVTQTWSDSIFLNFLMKTQGFFGFLFFYYLFFNYNSASCDDSVMSTIVVEPCGVAGIIHLHHDAMTFLLFILFLVTAIMGHAIYYFKGDQGKINYNTWLAGEQAIRGQPLKAGFDLVTGLAIIVCLGLIYYMYPSASINVSTTATTTESIVQNEFVAKPVNLLEKSSITDPFRNKFEKKCFADYKKGVYPEAASDVQAELSTWESRHLYRFESFNGRMHYADVYEPEDVIFTLYNSPSNSENALPVPSYRLAEHVNSPLAYESQEYIVKLSKSWMNHDSLHALANNAAAHGNSKKLYLMQNYLEGRRTVDFKVLQYLDTRLPDSKLGQMSDQQLSSACIKAQLIGLYGLDDVTKVIPPRMEFMLNNEHPQMVAKTLLYKVLHPR